MASIAQNQNLTIWVDVEDFFNYFEANPRPSGIQRLVFETLKVLPDRAALTAAKPRIAFVRHSDDAAMLSEITLDALVAMFDGQGAAKIGKPRRTTAKIAGVRKPPWSRLRLWLVERLRNLPPEISAVLLRAGVLQMAAFRQLRSVNPRRSSRVATAGTRVRQSTGFTGGPGDVFLIMGAPWSEPGYAAFLRRLRGLHGLEPALLIYDLIPVRRPEWCAADLLKKFYEWLGSTLPQCTCLMAISRATAADVEAYAREIGLPLAGPVKPVPIGTDFGTPTGASREPTPGLPTPGSYVLFVSTLEARKNHAILFRVWRRLLSELPRTKVPTLVFAGRVGWLVSDLMRQLDNTDWLDGKIRLLRDPTDAELAALYEGCQFTVFPSLFEGWGLPVSESLGRGQPCLTSNRTSLPESGGALARYFDPENLDDVYRAVRAIIDDPDGLQAWRAQVRRDYRHVPWEDTADAILAGCLAIGDAPETRVAEPAL